MRHREGEEGSALLTRPSNFFPPPGDGRHILAGLDEICLVTEPEERRAESPTLLSHLVKYQ